MASVIKKVSPVAMLGSLFKKEKASSGPSAADIAASEAAQAAASQSASEEIAKKRKASQAGIFGNTLGSGDAPNSLRSMLLGGGK